MEDWCCKQKVIMHSFNVKKRSISECLCSLLALLVCVIFSCIKIFNSLLSLIANCYVTLPIWPNYPSPSRQSAVQYYLSCHVFVLVHVNNITVKQWQWLSEWVSSDSENIALNIWDKLSPDPSDYRRQNYCQWHTQQKSQRKTGSPVPENRYRFLERLMCSLIQDFSGTSFW